MRSSIERAAGANCENAGARVHTIQQKGVPMTTFEPLLGIGVSEMQSAAGREVKRIMAEAGGDRLKADKIVLNKLLELQFITESELPVLTHICELGYAVTGGKHDAAAAHTEVKKAYEELLVRGNATPWHCPMRRAPWDPTCQPVPADRPQSSTRNQAATGKGPWPGREPSSEDTSGGLAARPSVAPSAVSSARLSTTADVGH